MVACRITDGRNIAANNHNLQRRSTGSLSGGQVPLKKYKQTRISRITTILIAILHWIWPPDRCTNCHSIYSSPNIDDAGDAATRRRSLSQIQRSVDGRFVLSTEKTKCSSALSNGKDNKDENDGPLSRRNSQGSQNSSSDDGGFLSRRNFITARASWRRPLVASPSQLSLQSAADSARGFLQGLGSLLRISAPINNQLDGDGNGGNAAGNSHNDDEDDDGTAAAAGAGAGATSGARYQNIQRTIYRNLMPVNEQQTMHIYTAASALQQQQHLHHDFASSNLYTPSKVSRIYSSSPASTPNGVQHLHHHHHHHHLLDGIGMVDDNDVDAGMLSSPWALATPPPHHYHSHYLNNFSDLSTVYPSSAERSLPTPAASGNLSRYRYYSHELPSLRTIQEETRRMNEHQQQEQQHQQHQHQQQQQQKQQQQQQQQHQKQLQEQQPQHTDQHGFVPLQIPSPPSWRSYYQQQHQTQLPYHSYRPRTRWYPRHYARLFGRTQSELLSPLPHLNLSMRSYGVGNMAGLEASPESRSSSSGFGSKNTSNHPGSTSEWRLLPPYRPPPPPPPPLLSATNSAYFGSPHALTSPASTQPQQAQAQAPTQRNSYSSATLPYYLPSSSSYFHHHHNPSHQHNYHHHHHSLQRAITPPYTMQHWLDMMSRLNAATDSVHLPKSVDVGSVDGHYEFDPSTPTPSASSQNGGLMRDDFNLHIDTTGHHSLGALGSSIFHTHTSAPSLSLSSAATFAGPQARKSRISRYDNIESRLQAMKEEFYAYRKRQAMKRAGVAEMESVC